MSAISAIDDLLAIKTRVEAISTLIGKDHPSYPFHGDVVDEIAKKVTQTNWSTVRLDVLGDYLDTIERIEGIVTIGQGHALKQVLRILEENCPVRTNFQED